MALLSMAIRDLGGEAISFTGSQAGIITNDRHVDARIIEVRPVRVQDELARGKIVIVAGYQGMSYKREITTLGRGGSDTTAVALAAALDAEWCEICSDVDGVYSADPRVVPGAERIPELSYGETREMAEWGAKVLNAQAVAFAEEKGIAIFARATSGPIPGDDPTSDGTVVRKAPPRKAGTVVGVAAQESTWHVRGNTPSIGTVLELAREFSLPTGQVRFDATREGYWFSMSVNPENVHHLGKLEKRVGEVLGDRVGILPRHGTVSVVGSGINESAEVLSRGNSVMEGFTIKAVSTSPRRITWVVPGDSIKAASRDLHEALIAG